jgi:protein phosphatase
VESSDPVLGIPARALVLLIGPSGAGKSTFAARHFRPTEILSSDAFRALVADDEADMRATPAAFDLLERVLAYRLRGGRLSVVDATNVTAANRRSMLELARRARRPAVAVVFDLSEELCQDRNRRRDGRVVDAVAVRRQAEHMRRSLADPDGLRNEGFAVVHRLSSPELIDGLRVVRAPIPSRRAPTRR